MTAAFQARLGCDACTHWLKEIDATLAVDMRHAAPLSSQRAAWPHGEVAAGEKQLLRCLIGAFAKFAAANLKTDETGRSTGF